MPFSTYHQTPVGWLRVTADDDSLLSVLFQEQAGLENDTHPLLTACTTQLDDYFNGTRTNFDLPLHPKGTAFQQKVWELLSNIPFGKTISYNTLAKQYGDIKAIRAVASANGQNPLAIIIPCHRVIGSNGTLTGYAGGLPRKQWLLTHETRIAAGVQQLVMNW